jgi:hypothetical protein
MAAINFKVELKSSGLLSSPLSLFAVDTIVATGVVAKAAKLITAVNGAAVTLFAKADFVEADKQALVFIKNTGSTHDLFVEAGTDTEFMKIKPGQFAVFPWYTDNTDGQDIKVYASNASGTNVDATLIEIT